MAPQLVTVFGGSGFLGRYIVQRLAESGARVRVAIRRPEEGLFLKPMGAVGQVEIVQANLRHAPSVAQAVAGADAVIVSVGVLYSRGAQSFNAVHAVGARTVARAATAAGVKRLVHVSALGADAESDSLYQQSKAAGEKAVKEAFPAATIVRPSIVFGPEDGFFNRFANMARYFPALPLIGGDTKFQPIFVDDVAAGVMAILGDPASAGRTYAFGGPRTYTFRELMQMILAVTGRNRLLVPVPMPIAMLKATFLGLLPAPLLTRDQVRTLQHDNVVPEGALTLAHLGVKPRPAEGIIESYLFRYRRGGQKVAPRFG